MTANSNLTHLNFRCGCGSIRWKVPRSAIFSYNECYCQSCKDGIDRCKNDPRWKDNKENKTNYCSFAVNHNLEYGAGILLSRPGHEEFNSFSDLKDKLETFTLKKNSPVYRTVATCCGTLLCEYAPSMKFIGYIDHCLEEDSVGIFSVEARINCEATNPSRKNVQDALTKENRVWYEGMPPLSLGLIGSILRCAFGNWFGAYHMYFQGNDYFYRTNKDFVKIANEGAN